MEKYGTPLAGSCLGFHPEKQGCIKGPITTPIGTGFRSVNVALRHTLNLYACVRPCKHYPGVRSLYRDVDVVIVRENTEDLYAGVEFEMGSPEAKQIQALAKGKIPDDAAIFHQAHLRHRSRRIVKYAFEYALANNRRKVTAVAKANIMKYSDGLFYRVAREVAAEYEGRIAYEEVLVDNMCMQLVQSQSFMRF